MAPYESRNEISGDGKPGEQSWWAPYLWDILPVVRAARRGGKTAQKKLTKLHEEGQQRLEHTAICNQWRDNAEEEERCAKVEALKAKFKTLGYQDPELDGLRDDKILAQFDLPITEHAWEDMRISLDHPDIMKSRQALAREAYRAYVPTLVPIEATRLPSIAGLDAIPEVRTICEHEPDVDVTSADFAAIPAILASWVAKKRTMLIELASNAVSAESNRFSLASTVFRCEVEHGKLGRPAVFGGDEAMRHVGESWDPRLDIELSKIASELIVSPSQ
ncbi:hypothetical protein C8R43DRAFT_1137490 [Mycena crocata]|nr:hypothetical protein C8R43DRAFT_1137490 [Mycena crocata]